MYREDMGGRGKAKGMGRGTEGNELEWGRMKKRLWENELQKREARSCLLSEIAHGQKRDRYIIRPAWWEY